MTLLSLTASHLNIPSLKKPSFKFNTAQLQGSQLQGLLVNITCALVITAEIAREALKTFAAIAVALIALTQKSVTQEQLKPHTRNTAEPQPEPQPTADDPLLQLSRKELMQMAGTKSRRSKAQLIARIHSQTPSVSAPGVSAHCVMQ